jgi:hypothetical protein
MDVGTFNFEYLVLERVPDEKRKTLLVSVLSRRHGDLLGMIRWYGPWRQYVDALLARLYVGHRDRDPGSDGRPQDLSCQRLRRRSGSR